MLIISSDGLHKYRPSMMRGTVACRRVQNLFHSVSLNVNNPHFLIMQGRITKVSPCSIEEVLDCGLSWSCA